MAEQLRAIVLGPGEGQALWHLGARMTFKATGGQTNDRFWALEGHANPHMDVPLHTHAHDDEIWFVAEGEIAFQAGDDVFTGGPGTFVWIPAGLPHTFKVRSGEARWFGIGLPGGFDRWFFETGAPAGGRGLPPPPPGPPSVDDIRGIEESLLRYGTDTVGPPLS